jgi:hypothetical protein
VDISQWEKHNNINSEWKIWSNNNLLIGAVFALKRKKMLEKEVAKLDGQMVLLEQQRLMIESKLLDLVIFISFLASIQDA